MAVSVITNAWKEGMVVGMKVLLISKKFSFEPTWSTHHPPNPELTGVKKIRIIWKEILVMPI